jgi:hypothetical protein
MSEMSEIRDVALNLEGVLDRAALVGVSGRHEVLLTVSPYGAGREYSACCRRGLRFRIAGSHRSCSLR